MAAIPVAQMSPERQAKVREYSRWYHKLHKEKEAAYTKMWCKLNPEKRKIIAHRRYIKRREYYIFQSILYKELKRMEKNGINK